METEQEIIYCSLEGHKIDRNYCSPSDREECQLCSYHPTFPERVRRLEEAIELHEPWRAFGISPPFTEEDSKLLSDRFKITFQQKHIEQFCEVLTGYIGEKIFHEKILHTPTLRAELRSLYNWMKKGLTVLNGISPILSKQIQILQHDQKEAYPHPDIITHLKYHITGPFILAMESLRTVLRNKRGPTPNIPRQNLVMGLADIYEEITGRSAHHNPGPNYPFFNLVKECLERIEGKPLNDNTIESFLKEDLKTRKRLKKYQATLLENYNQD